MLLKLKFYVLLLCSMCNYAQYHYNYKKNQNKTMIHSLCIVVLNRTDKN